MEDIAFNDWPGQDLSGSSPWLPAYGYQPPGAILEKEDFLGSPDAALFLNGNVNAASQYVFLETIVEETSDDLRSDSSGPLAGGWLASGSESGSVIRLDLATGTNDDEDELDDCDGSASECDMVCPAKRRRHDCNLLSVPSGAGGTMDDSTSLSRSSSLLQFETLEKRCQDDMYNSSPSILSSLSYEEKRPNFSPDSLNDSDSDSFQSDPECYRNEVQFRDSLFYKTKLLEAKNCDADCETSSDTSDEMIEKSKLKSDCFKFSGKTFHSFDDLNTKSTKRSNDKISAENLSEDSGYCDNMYLKHKSSSNPNFYVVNTENNSNKETKKNHQDMLRKTNNKKRHSTGFEAYDGETIVSTTSACSQFGASYHDLSIFDPERISQHRIFIEKIQSGINNNPFTRGCSGHDRNLKLEPTRTSEFVSAPKNNFVESNSEPNLTVYRLEESEDCHNFTDCFTKDIRFATKEFSKSLDRFTFDNSEVTCGGVSSVPRDLNLAGDCWAFVNPSSPSIAAKNWDLGDLSKQELHFTDNFTSVFVNNDINSSDEEKMATKRILKNETIKNSKLNNDNSTCILGNVQKNKTLNNYDYSTFESSSFKSADGYTNLLDDSPEDHCYNIDIQTDILEFEENLEKAISNSSIPSFKDKDEFLFHSTPINKRTVLSTPNLTTFESEIDFIKNITDNVAIRNTAPLKNDPSLSKGLSGSEGRNIGGILQTGMSANKSSIAGSGSTSKGVHFCEVVSEVCWREASYSDEASSAYSESDIVSGSDNDDDAIYAHKMRNKNNTHDDNDNNSETDSENNYCFNNETVKSRDIKEVNEQYDNNVNITEKKNVKTLNNAYVKNGELEDGVDCKHLDTNTTTVTPTINAGTASHVVAGTGEHPAVNNQLSRPADSVTVMESKSEVLPALAQPQQMKRPKSANKLGGFLSRFTNFRFSTRSSKHDRKKQTISAPICTTEINNTNSNAVKINSVNNETKQTDYIYIPLKGPVEKDSQVNETEYVTDKTFSKILIDGKPVELGGKVDSKVNSKPPLPKQPPRVVGASVKRQNNAQACVSGPRSIDSCSGGSRLRYAGSSASSADNRHVLSPMEIPPGLIETDLDTHITVVSSSGPNGKKTRSLMNLDSGLVEIRPGEPGRRIHQVSGDVGALQSDTVRPHKSMEFLLDKQNLKVVEPPENELQKGTGERIMSEHQLRVQRSLQKLNVPDWFKQSQVPREGFLLKKRETTKWQGFSGKTTSLSSLGGSRQSPVLLSPSPQSTTAGFSRWSTSKLNSTASSPCNSTRSSFNYRQPFTGLLANGTTSPCGSTRSSFSYRQPYLGWRSQSQERLTKPRTPAERLATSILPPTSTTASTPNSEIQTSIKEVTSAIVHYVSGLKPDSTTHVDSLGIIKHESRGSSPRLERDSISASPRLRDYEYQETASQRSRSISPSSRGSQKLCWLESSFVGTRPLDSPQTPIGLAADVSETIKSPNYTGLHLDLKTKNQGELMLA